MAKQTVILSFNKDTGIYTGMIYHGGGALDESGLNTDYYVYKTVELDPELETWSGSYQNGSIVSLANQPMVVNETQIQAVTQERIFRHYKYYKQINLVMGVIDQLVDIANPDTSTTYADLNMTDYNEFKTFMENQMVRHAERVQRIIDDPNYILRTKEEELAMWEATYAGEGLQDEIEPEYPLDIIK